jgi:hypothetical protein
LDYGALKRIVAALAAQVGRSLDYTELAKASRASLPTVKKLVNAFQSLFLIRLVPCEGDYSRPIVYFEDIGELNFLRLLDPDAASTLTAFLYHNMRTQAHYRPESRIELFSYRTRRGADIPLCFRAGGKVLGVLPVEAGDLSRAVQVSERFVKAYPGSGVVLVSKGAGVDSMLSTSLRHISVECLV